MFSNSLQHAQERIETVQEVYQKHWTEDKISEDGRHRTSTTGSIVKQANQQTKQTSLMINSPRRTLAPKSLSHALKAANLHQPALNGKNNVGLELVKPVHNFAGNGFDDAFVSTIDESIVNSPILRKNGLRYYEKRIITTTTTTTTTKTETLEECIVPTNGVPDLGPIAIGTFHIMVFLSLQMKSKLIENSLSNRRRRR